MAANRPLSFGRYLQSVRMDKGIALETVARQTRINIDLLLCIEREDIDRLPAAVFVKGFLRSYAKAVGADGELAVSRYLDQVENHRQVADQETAVVQSGTRFWLQLLFALAALTGLAVFVIWSSGGSGQSDGDHPPTAVPKAADSSTERRFEGDGAEHHGGKNTAEHPPSSGRLAVPADSRSGEHLRLVIEATAPTWVKVIVDDQEPRAINLTPEQKVTLDADSGFNLLIGDAGAVRIAMNGKSLPVPGKSGQVVNIQLP